MSRLAARTSAAASGALLVVPVGATEQHGPHLPLGTDTEIAAALAAGLAERIPGVLVAPPLPYGSSGEHREFAGTLSIGRQATALTLVELTRSALRSFDRVLLLCAHGGNADALSDALATLRRERRDARAWSPGWSGDAHAGRLETSLMLAIAPGAVDLGAAAAGNLAPLAELLPLLRERGVRALSANGVLGDPAGASAEEGRALLAAELDRLGAMVTAWLG